MVLVYFQSPSEGADQGKLQLARKAYLQYEEVVKEIRLAVDIGYELSWVNDDETDHCLTYMKYNRGDTMVHYLSVRGTAEEIGGLQQLDA